MWRKRKQQDFQAEIEAHLQLEADQLRAEGKPPAEALANARRAFGNRTIAEERFQEASGWLWLKHLIQRCPLRCVTLAGLGGCFALTSMTGEPARRGFAARRCDFPCGVGIADAGGGCRVVRAGAPRVADRSVGCLESWLP
jgi:hypothetical protein